MNFQEAYTKKEFLRKQIEETKFNNLVRELVRQKHITRAEAEKVAQDILRERRYNALKVEDYIATQRAREEEKRLAAIRRAEALKAKLEKEKLEEIERDRIRRKIKALRKKKLEEKYKAQLIKEALAAIPRRVDTLGRELENFEGKVNRFLEPLKYGILTAQKLTGKPRRMFINERAGLLNEMGRWFDKWYSYLSPEQRKRYYTLVDRLTSQEI